MNAPTSVTAHKVDTRSSDYLTAEDTLKAFLRTSSIPDRELAENCQLFLTPQHLRRLLYFYEIYKLALPVPGVIMQFGVRWGRELALFDALRTTFEPFNHSRRIIGFDTFAGYESLDPKDGASSQIQPGNLSTTPGYERELAEILRLREQLSPLPHVQKFDVIKGDVCETLPAYLNDNPYTVVSLVHLDLNLYKPTKVCLELLQPHLTKGSVVVIDEVNLKTLPGETIAAREVFGLQNIRLRRLPDINPTWPAFFTVE